MNSKNISARSLSILVCSCDKFSDVWPVTERAFELNWGSCPFDVFLMTNLLDFDSKTLRTLRIGPDESWTKNLKSALIEMKSEYVILWLDDCFLSKPVDSKTLLNDVAWMEKNAVPYLRLRRTNNWGRFSKSSYRIIDAREPYRASILASVWERKYLLSLLYQNQTPWEFETNNQITTSTRKFFEVNRNRFSYVHAVEKGLWKTSGLRFAQKLKPDFSAKDRGLEENNMRSHLKNYVVKNSYEWCPAPFRGSFLAALANLKKATANFSEG